MSYRYLEHVGDAAIEATGTTLEEAFAEAGRAMFGLMVNAGAAAPAESVEIEITAATPGELLVEFLNELLAQQGLHALIFTECAVRGISRAGRGYRLRGTASGLPPRKLAGRLGAEVKAASYLGLKVGEEGGHYVARCVLDL
jgi:SHS2 domain-containing protein